LGDDNLLSCDTKVIEMFTDELSPICNQARALFKEFSVPFVEKNIVRDREAFKDFMKFKLGLVPSFIFAGRLYEGYDPNLWAELISRHFDISIPKNRLRIVLPKKRPWIEIPKKIISYSK
jgi:hypothetical protein